jgi:EmrB/QacA subfamily drug resistance transporter
MRPLSAEERRAALIAAGLGSFLPPFMGSAVNIGLPALGAELALVPAELTWVVNAYALTSAMFLLPFGRLADLYGRKRVFASGTALYALASLASALAPSAGFLIAMRAVQGVGAAMVFSTGMALLTSLFPKEQRGRVLGLNVAMVYFGLSSGPVLGGLLTDYLGWRSLFWFNVPLGALAVLAIARVREEWAKAERERFDIPGALACSLTLLLLMLALTTKQQEWRWYYVAGALLSFGLFVWLEKRSASPLLDIALFTKSPVFAFSNVAALISYSATMGVGFLMSLYLQEVRGLSPRGAGWVMVCQPLIMALLSPVAGRLSDRFESRVLASAGMALTALGLAWLVFVDGASPLSHVIGGLSVMGLGFGLFSSPNTNAAMSAVEQRHYGVASATLGTMRLTGSMLSMGTITLLLIVHMGTAHVSTENQPAFVTSMQSAFGLFAVLCFLGIFASAARGRVHKG